MNTRGAFVVRRVAAFAPKRTVWDWHSRIGSVLCPRVMVPRLATPLFVAACSLAALTARAQATTEVQGLVVTPGPGPMVQSTYPAPGGTVPGGVLILKIVFDQPM